MPKRRKKKIVRIIHQSAGPLPLRLAAQYADHLLVFSDASQKRHGGLAAVLFDNPESEPLVSTRTVTIIGSNELELQAALFALAQAQQHFPGRQLALFSDNQDAVIRLARTQEKGSAQDPELLQMLAENGISSLLENATICWIKGHSTCRGNTLADIHAAEAAS
jgi:ribonuclease HI